MASAALLSRNPITGIAGCCARAVRGDVTVAPPRSVMNSRRRIFRSQAQETQHCIGSNEYFDRIGAGSASKPLPQCTANVADGSKPEFTPPQQHLRGPPNPARSALVLVHHGVRRSQAMVRPSPPQRNWWDNLIKGYHIIVKPGGPGRCRRTAFCGGVCTHRRAFAIRRSARDEPSEEPIDNSKN